MSEMMDFYQKEASMQISANPLLPKLQKEALAEFEGFGFPTRLDEDWKYSYPKSFLEHKFATHKPLTQLDNHAISVMANSKQMDVPVGLKVTLINGIALGLDLLATALPNGVLVLPLQDALASHPNLVLPYLGKLLTHEHGFQALNTAMLSNGLFIYVPKDVCVADPLLITHWQTESDEATYLRHLVVAESGSVINLIEDYQGQPATSYFTNTVTEIFLADSAVVTHYKMQRESKLAYHVGHIAAKVNAKARFDSHLFQLGGKWVRSDIKVNLIEEKANCLLNGLYLPHDGQHMSQHTTIHHDAPACISEQDYKGILTGTSRAVFNGKVVVAKHANGTEARQQNKNLLLSKTAEIDTKPQLDIYADDVLCTHGATVGQLDAEALFYLATRGILHSEASRYLIQAFIAENIQKISDNTLSNWISSYINGGCQWN